VTTYEQLLDRYTITNIYFTSFCHYQYFTLNNIVAETNDHVSVSISIAALQLELCHVAATTVSFYTSPVTSEKYPTLAKLGLRVLGIFSYTYRCECMFSIMNHIQIVIEHS